MTEVLGVVLQFMPLIILLLLANGAEKLRRMEPSRRSGTSMVLTVLSYSLLAVTFVILLLAGILLTLLGWLHRQGDSPVLTIPGAAPELARQITEALPLIGAGFWIPSLLGLLLLIPPVRRLIARFLPVDVSSRVHTISLSSSMLIWMYFFFFLAIGLQTITQLTSGQSANPAPTLWAQQITFFLLALVGVGWLIRRNLRDSFRRLGLKRPTWHHVTVGITSGLILVAGALLLQSLASWLGFPGDPQVEKLTDQLLGPLYGSIWGILTLGLSAALGEEAVFRGAILPRFGLIYTSLLFALVHSNYGLSISTLVVFVVGLVLGLLRLRYDTTTTMVVHATYNITLGLIAAASV